MSRLLYLLVSLYLGISAFGSAEAVTTGLIDTCTGCHGTDPATNQAPIESTSNQRNIPDRAIIGSHSSHGSAQDINSCSTCHGTLPTGTAGLSHMNTYIDLNATISGGTYQKTLPLKVSNTFVGAKCSAVSCHGAGLSPDWGVKTTAASCTKCHGVRTVQTSYSSANAWQAAPGYSQGGVAALPDGAHDSHLRGTKGYTAAYQIKCSDCHTIATTSSHATKITEMTWSNRAKNIGTDYASTGPLNPNYTRPTCTTNYCHGSAFPAAIKGNNDAPAWNSTTYLSTGKNTANCNQCHQSPPVNSVGGAHTTFTISEPCTPCHKHEGNGATHINGTLEKIKCEGCHTFPPDTAAHIVHANKIAAITGSTADASCGTCHDTSSAVHADQKTDIVVNASYKFGASDPSYAKGTTETCSNVSCHLGSTPAWGAPPSIACEKCHGYAPVTADGPDNKHVSAVPVNHVGTGASVNTNETFVSAHNGCTTCHGMQSSTPDGNGVETYGTGYVSTMHENGSIAINSLLGYNQTNPRTCSQNCHAVQTGHSMVASTLPVELFNGDGVGDCLTCHETAKASPIAQSLSASVTSRVAVTPSFGTSFTSKHIRSRTASPAVTKMDCGVCHMEGDATTGSPNATYHGNGYIELRDPDTGATIKGVTHTGTTSTAGAYSSTATDARFVRFSRNLGSATLEAATQAIMVNQCLKCHDADGALSTLARVPGGSAMRPFAATITTNSAYGSNVLNVAGQFNGANRAFHPVLARNNAALTNSGGTRMYAPWNGVTKTGSSTVYGPLMTCWDCHAPRNTASTVTLTTSLVHGATPTSPDNVVLRGPVDNNSSTASTSATNLCIYCHVVGSTTLNHGAGSGITSAVDSGMTYFNNRCYFCHSSASSTTKPARPTPAGDVHGYNGLTDFAGPTTLPANRGYAFFRRTGLAVVVKVGATGTPSCGAGSGICSNSMDGGGYTPGGVY